MTPVLFVVFLAGAASAALLIDIAHRVRK